MKAVILNDTSTERHHGCSRVMDQIYNRLADDGVTVIAKSYLNADPQSVLLKAQIDSSDVTIINGEGTIHHDRPYAEAMLRLVANSSAAIKVLFNTTYDSNPPRYREYLEEFDYVFVRDTRSRHELSEIGVKSVVVPDMTFLAPPSANKQSGHGIRVCDSVDREVLVKLHDAGQALGNKASPISIFEPPKSVVGRVVEFRRSLAKRDLTTPVKMIRIALARRWFDSQTCDNHNQFALQIAQSDFLLTGRYHAVCMAIKNKTPFLAIDSNTFKVRALLEDIGLADRCLSKSEFLGGASLEFRPFTIGELDLIDDFIRRADRSIQEMFKQILAHG